MLTRRSMTAHTRVVAPAYAMDGNTINIVATPLFHVGGTSVKDLILTGGGHVYPAEVERVLGQHPDISDVAVIGVHRLARYKSPTSVSAVPRCPAIPPGRSSSASCGRPFMP